MRIKRIICGAAAVIMALGMLTGCGSKNNEDTRTVTDETPAVTSSESSEETTAATTEAATDASSEDTTESTTAASTGGKTLVVYYSASGRTQAVAETLADTLSADLFEITPTEPYTDDDLNWTNDDSRVSREHNDESLRDVELTQVTPDNWESYDTILIGYPIWWGIAAWPVNNFVKGNDFTGKTVIPFCTSASSGIGDSGNLLAEMAGSGDWQDGQRFSSGASDSEVSDWANSLNLSK